MLAVDKMIGELQAAVASIGQARKTYFIFSSDNGYHMAEFRLMPGKMSAYDTDVRVPLLVTGPKVPAGRTFEEIVENIDLNPTFNELAAATTFPFADGVSLVPLWQGRTTGEWRGVALVEHHGPLNDPVDPDMPSPRSGNPTTYSAIRLRGGLYVEYSDGKRSITTSPTTPTTCIIPTPTFQGCKGFLARDAHGDRQVPRRKGLLGGPARAFRVGPAKQPEFPKVKVKLEAPSVIDKNAVRAINLPDSGLILHAEQVVPGETAALQGNILKAHFCNHAQTVSCANLSENTVNMILHGLFGKI